jgi:urease accessory protein
MTLPTAQILYRKGHWPQLAVGCVVLGYDARFLRRKRLVTAGGDPFLVDLADTTNLLAGDAFGLSDGRLIEIRAADEEVMVITGDLTRLAWHIGNRHTPCQIEPTRLVIRADHVLADMLRGLGATVSLALAPFTPEGGAYGQGRTMGHEHAGHEQGGHEDGGQEQGGP